MQSHSSKSLRGRILFYVVLAIILFAIVPVVFIIMALTSKDMSKLGQAVSTAAPFVAVYLVLLVVAAVLNAIRLSKQISGTLGNISEKLAEMGKGSLSVHVDYSTEDEIGQAAKSLNSFADELKNAIHALSGYLEKISDGDMTVKSEYAWNGDWTEIGIVLKTISEKLNSTFLEVSNAADQTANGSEQVASGSQALAQGATEQASSIEQLSATVTEISEHVKHNATNATNADRASALAEEKIIEANQSMQQMVQAMAQISDTSNKISNIIKTIDDIAFQTNILALNAAVEAARAGSAGKGFAVVADEVRNLASKSAEAAKDTTALIEDSIKAVDEGKKIAEVTEKTLLEVKSASSESNKLVNEIASASNQQAASIGQITQGVQQISAVVQTNSATAEQSAAASEELAAQAKSLKHTLATIKLNNTQSVSAFKPEKRVHVPTAHVQEHKIPKADTTPVKHDTSVKHEVPVKLDAPVKAASVTQSVNDKYI